MPTQATSTAAADQTETYRPPLHQRAIMLGMGVFGVVPAVAVFFHDDAPRWGIALLVSLAAITAVASALALRARIEVSPEGVVVQNGVRRHRLRWDEIDRFEIVEIGFTKGRVKLRNGRSIGSPVITPSRIARAADVRTSAHETVERLNRHASRRHTETTSTGRDRHPKPSGEGTTPAVGASWTESLRQTPLAAVPVVGLYAASSALNEPARRLAALRALYVGHIPLPILTVGAAAFITSNSREVPAAEIAVTLALAFALGGIGQRAVNRLVPLPWRSSRSELGAAYVKRCLMATALANAALFIGFIVAVQLDTPAHAQAAIIPFALILLKHAPSEGHIRSLDSNHVAHGGGHPLSDALTATRDTDG